jgi:hypothetical protein
MLFPVSLFFSCRLLLWELPKFEAVMLGIANLGTITEPYIYPFCFVLGYVALLPVVANMMFVETVNLVTVKTSLRMSVREYY